MRHGIGVVEHTVTQAMTRTHMLPLVLYRLLNTTQN